MKKLLLLFCLLQSYISLNAQAYQPFPTDSAVWTTHTYTSYSSNYASYYLRGDTVINGNLYHKLYSGNLYYQGSIRDTSKKILFIEKDSLQDVLLYDFNLVVGDTVKSSLIDTGCIAIVESIDSIFIKNIWHKRLNIKGLILGNCFNSGALIEGIGSSFGLLETFAQHLVTSELVCVRISNGVVYNPSGSGRCNVVSIRENNQKISVKLYPNPLVNISTLDLSSIPKYFGKIEFFNSIGQKVKEEKLNNSSRYQISKEEFVPGYYLYKLSNSNDFVTGKFIVQ